MSTKVSVLIIAHNEERYIARCIKSLLQQTKRPDEIVLLAHNCTDKTVPLAQQYPITVVPFNGPKGIVPARLEGLSRVSGDIILCIDGDSFASENWVEVMAATLQKGHTVLVGSRVRFKGAVFGYILNIYGRNLPISKHRNIAHWMWGASLAIWGRDKEFVGQVWQNSKMLSQKLGLIRNLEDYWLAMTMSKRGGTEVTNKTYVTAVTKNASSISMFIREREDRVSKQKINEYFEKMGDTIES